MHLPTREQAGVLIVSVSGRIDHTASEEFTQALDPLLVCCARDTPLLLDFSGVDYISSAGLARADDGFPSLKGTSRVFAIADAAHGAGSVCNQPLQPDRSLLRHVESASKALGA
jgi:anti-sigma B factor antagonist/stage II sporulation protein AA (anti-sigma F factor antagonist)